MLEVMLYLYNFQERNSKMHESHSIGICIFVFSSLAVTDPLRENQDRSKKKKKTQILSLEEVKKGHQRSDKRREGKHCNSQEAKISDEQSLL